MARLKLSSIVESVTGKLAGNTFLHNRGGQVLRNNANILQNPSSRQKTIRRYNKTIASAWAGLSTSARSQWFQASNTPEYYGQRYNEATANAYRLFYISNIYRLISSMVILTVPPTITPLARYTDLTLNINQSTNMVNLRFALPFYTPATFVFVYATSGHKKDLAASSKKYRFIIQAVMQSGNTIQAVNQYKAAWRVVPASGSYVTFKFVFTNSQRTTPTKEIFVTARAT